jgi:hypothetical protein
MLTLNTNSAKQADVVNSAIKETGKYIGTITRAEALTSKNNNQGVGISLRSDSGETADYLDLYMGETDGKPWGGSNTVNAILCCLKLKQASIGKVKIERWNSDIKAREEVVVDGFPDIQGKRIGFLLQKELTTYKGETKEKLNIYGVFNADTELTASEILSSATKPEKLAKILTALLAKPIKDSRTNKGAPTSQDTGSQSENPGHGMSDSFSDDIPFNREGACGLWRSM